MTSSDKASNQTKSNSSKNKNEGIVGSGNGNDDGTTTPDTVMEDVASVVSNKEKKEEKKSSSDSRTKAAAAAPIPLLKGTLTYNLETNRHIIRGMWNYSSSNGAQSTMAPQRFELVRTLSSDEDITTLPLSGEFHGSFSLLYTFQTNKGKQKSKSQVVMEDGVQLNFTQDGEKYKVKGQGNNQFGTFSLKGSATRESSTSYNVEMTKVYIPSAAPLPSTSSNDAITTTASKKSKSKSKNLKRKQPSSSHVAEDSHAPPPPPSMSYASNVVCMKGKVSKDTTQDTISNTFQTIHHVKGVWAAGLDILESSDADKLLSFHYEHRSSSSSTPSSSNNNIPLSGRYTGYFNLLQETQQVKKIQEKDLLLKFILNSSGYYNVEGKGWNVFGKYSISGFCKNSEITIFRHFIAAEEKKKEKSVAIEPSNKAEDSLLLSLDDVVVPSSSSDPPEPITPPQQGLYSAVSRGVLKISADGAHTCSGKWAMTREHYTNNMTSNFHFGLEVHQAILAAKTDEDQEDDLQLAFSNFPLDSAYYKGSFKMRRGTTKYQSIVDKQLVLKFVMNKGGFYNIHGIGSNSIGKFILLGTLIPSSKSSGQLELYRIYSAEPEQPSNDLEEDTPAIRSSRRTSKPPIHLSEDNPTALQGRIKDKCLNIFKFIKEKDSMSGSYFAKPVDAIALNIPNYYNIITNPMDLSTLEQEFFLDTKKDFEWKNFAEKMNLIFENAIQYNVETTHAVNVAARNLKSLFLLKLKEVEKDGEKLHDIMNPKSSLEKSMSQTTVNGLNNSNSIHYSISRGKEMSKMNPPKKKKRTPEISNMTSGDHLMKKKDYVSRSEFEQLQKEFREMKHTLETIQATLLQHNITVNGVGNTTTSSASTTANHVTPVAPPAPIAPPTPPLSPPADEKPLTLAEQEMLTEKINCIDQSKLPGIISIIRESTCMNMNGDEEEIDLEIDQLDTKTQRKLQRFVLESVSAAEKKEAKKSIEKKKKVVKKKSTTNTEKKVPSAKKTTESKKEPAPPSSTATSSSINNHKNEKSGNSKSNSNSFFSFGKGLPNNSFSSDDDDDDDDDSLDIPSEPAKTSSNTKIPKSKSDSFLPPDDNKMNNYNSSTDDDDDDYDQSKNKWTSIQQTATSTMNNNADDNSSSSSASDEDPLWSSARKKSIQNSHLDQIRSTKKQKLLENTAAQQQQNLKEATQKIKSIQAAQLAKQTQENEQKEKLIKETRQKLREEIQNVKADVDLEAQRDIMKKYEQSFQDGGYDFGSGSASPSSDFGF